MLKRSMDEPDGSTKVRLATFLMAAVSGFFLLSPVGAFADRASEFRTSHPHPTQQNPTHQNPIDTGSGPSNLDTCFSPDEACDQKLIDFIHKANTTLDIAIYSITHPKITSAIIEMRGKGVAVRMVVDRREAKGKGSTVDTLVSAGVPLKIGNVRGIMHSKYTIVDGGMLETGSYNYTDNATTENAENQIYLTDAGVLQRYQGEFEKLWSAGESN